MQAAQCNSIVSVRTFHLSWNREGWEILWQFLSAVSRTLKAMKHGKCDLKTYMVNRVQTDLNGHGEGNNVFKKESFSGTAWSEHAVADGANLCSGLSRAINCKVSQVIIGSSDSNTMTEYHRLCRWGVWKSSSRVMVQSVVLALVRSGLMIEYRTSMKHFSANGN